MNSSLNLRSISTFIMIAAIAASLLFRSAAKVTENPERLLQNRQNDLVIRIIVAEAVTAKNMIPDQLMQKARETEKLFDLMGGASEIRTVITKGIILDYLGSRELMQRIELPPQTDPDHRIAYDYIQLYEKSSVLPDDSPLFTLQAGQLAFIRNLRTASRTQEADQADRELFESSLRLTTLIFLTASGSVLLFAGSIITLILFFRSKPRPYFPEALSGITLTERNAMFETVILFLFLMFPAGMILQSVLYGKLNLKDTIDPLYLQMIWIPLIFLFSVNHFRSSHPGAAAQYRRILYSSEADSLPFREILWGIAGFIGIFPVALISTIITVQLSGENPANPENAHPLVFGLGRSPLLIFFFAAVIVPIIEEVIFRGFLFGYLRLKFGLYFSAFISGSIFALLHPQGWIALPYLTILGMGLAVLREYRPGIIAPVVTHSIVNGMAVVMSYMILYS